MIEMTSAQLRERDEAIATSAIATTLRQSGVQEGAEFDASFKIMSTLLRFPVLAAIYTDVLEPSALEAVTDEVER